MTQKNEIAAHLKSILPDAWHEAVDELASTTLQTDSPLRVTLVGPFSVGKSSLLNMLLGQKILLTAKEESTALPTFIEYGEQRSMQLVSNDGALLALDEDGFCAATTKAPEGAACALLNLPLEWLKGMSIIDLPGLGSVSAAHRDYTLAQIQQSDAILYLIEPRGPAQADLATLQQISQLGKRVKVIVARWDEVEAAMARGEKTPSLEQWASQIEVESGLKIRLAPVNRDGLGREEILDFLERSKKELVEIRLRRFRAELLPVLENALGQNIEDQRSCEVRSKEAAQALHQELMQRKQALTEFNCGLYDQKNQDREQLDRQAADAILQQRGELINRLRNQANNLADESAWDVFATDGADLLRAALAKTAMLLSELSSSYGDLKLPEAQVVELNLRLPLPESVEANDFLDMARLSQLQSELAAAQAVFIAKEQSLAQLPISSMDEQEQALHEMLMQRQQIAAQPLAHIVQRISGGNGAAVGRVLGEIADIGLFFVNPTTVGAKVAALFGKGAKMANIASNTVSIVTKGVEVVQAVQSGKKIAGIPQEAIAKLGMLEMLSLGYWGERVGSMLGGGPRDEQTIDPAARAEQERALAATDAHVLTLRHDLDRSEDIANERQLTGWALTQNQKEQVRLKADLERLTQEAKHKHQEAKEALCQNRQILLARHAEKAVAQWLRGYTQQTNSMMELLRGRVKSYWENRVDSLVAERIAEVDALAVRADASPLEKEAVLKQFRQEAAAIQVAIGEVS